MKTDNKKYYVTPVMEAGSYDLYTAILDTSSTDGASSESFQDESTFEPIW